MSTLLAAGLSRDKLLDATLHGERFAVTGNALRKEALQPGAPADFMVLNRTTLDRDGVIESDDAALVVQ